MCSQSQDVLKSQVKKNNVRPDKIMLSLSINKVQKYTVFNALPVCASQLLIICLILGPYFWWLYAEPNYHGVINLLGAGVYNPEVLGGPLLSVDIEKKPFGKFTLKFTMRFSKLQC